MKILKCAKTMYISCSALICLLGLALIIWPSASSITICRVLGTVLAVCGAAKIIGYFSRDAYALAFQFDLALGVFVTALGVVLIICPEKIIQLLPVIVGLYILVDGVFKLQTSFDAKRFGLGKWWLILIGGGVCAALGIMLMLDSASGGAILATLVGVSLLADGLQNLFNAFYTVKLIKNAAKPDDYIEIKDYEVK